jgi:integrase
MAKSKKNASGRWAVQIQIAGVRESGTFDTKREADAWAARRSMELRDGKLSGDKDTRKTLRDALQRYAKEVSPTKKGWRWEILRLAAFEQSDHALLPLAKRIDIVAASDLGRWRDYRLLSVSRGTVLREMGLLSAVLECARREWGWCKTNAVHDVRKPAQPDHRERIISGVEIRKMLRQLGWPQKAAGVRSVSSAVAVCFFVALQTGMRAGELCSVRWGDVHADFLRIQAGKTGRRDVPLSQSAARAVEIMRGWDDSLVFGLKSQTLDALFRKARARAGLEGFTFHDSRHTAATRLAQKLHVLDLCRMFGWKNTSRALTYYNPRAGDIARRI